MTDHKENYSVKGIDLREINLKEGDMYGWHYDKYTKFPEGFNPMENHMIYIGEGDEHNRYKC